MNRFIQGILVVGMVVMVVFTILSYLKIGQMAEDINFIKWRSYAIEEANNKLKDIKDDVNGLYINSYDISSIANDVSSIRRNF